MRAAVYREAGAKLQVENVTYGPMEHGEVKVNITACGVCHSDLHFIDGGFPFMGASVLGHEAAGIVEEVGAGVTSVVKGDHVVIAFHGACGYCFYCVKGMRNLCERSDDPARSFMGPRPRLLGADEKPLMQGVGVAGFAESTILPEGSIIKVREDAPLDKICLVGCGVMTGVGAAIHTAKVEPGSTVAVIGCGGVGLNVIQGARLAGAHRIIAIDMVPGKLDMAAQFGATHFINAGKEDPVAKAMELGGGRGPDYAFEVIGLKSTVEQAFNMIRPGGTAVVVGVGAIGVSAEVSILSFLQEKKLIGSLYGSGQVHVDIPRIIDLYMDGKLLIDELVSKTRPLGEINEAFEDMKKGAVARTVLNVHN